MDLEGVVKRADRIVEVQMFGSIRSASMPKDAFDGTVFRVVSFLKGGEPLDGGFSVFGIDRGASCANDYRPSKPIEEVFPFDVELGERGPRGIVFLRRTPAGAFRLVCPHAFESVDKRADIERLVLQSR